MRIVLRNKGRGRRDAVYVLDAQGFLNDGTGGSFYWVMAYWGKWGSFDPSDLEALQSQVKYEGEHRASLMTMVQKLVAEKLGNGYLVQEDVSRLPDWPILLHGQNWRKWE